MIDRNKYINNYKKENYKRFIVELPKEKYSELKNHTQETGESINGFIKRAIDETLHRDTTSKD